jgi:hypothetical protein
MGGHLRVRKFEVRKIGASFGVPFEALTFGYADIWVCAFEGAIGRFILGALAF